MVKEGHDKMEFDFGSDNIDYGTDSESEDIESSGELSSSSSDSQDRATM